MNRQATKNSELALPEELQAENAAMVRQVTLLKVTDVETYQLADELGRTIKNKMKSVLAFFEPMRLSTDDAHKAVLRAREAAVGPLRQAEEHLNLQVSAYRRAEQQRQREIEAKREAEERKRIAQQRAKEAEAARARGREALAKTIESAPIEVAVEKAESTLPSTGSKLRRNWKFRIVDAQAVPREWCSPDPIRIGQFVRDNKEKAIAAIPGVEVYADDKTTW